MIEGGDPASRPCSPAPEARRGRGSRLIHRLAPGLVASAVLIGTMWTLTEKTTLSELRWPRRYWEDTSAAIKLYVDHRFPRQGGKARLEAGDAQRLPEDVRSLRWRACQSLVVEKTQRWEIRPTQFWRTLPARPFLFARAEFTPVRPHEDRGRALALAAGFWLLDGVAPYLLLWLGVLACIPVLIWMAWEFSSAGYTVAGGTLALLFATSPYAVGCLSLAHSGVGFYLIALLGLFALSGYAVLGKSASPLGLFARALCAGTLLVLCALCRSDALFLLPGFVLALCFACLRIHSARRAAAEGGSAGRARTRLKMLASVIAVCGVFILPIALLWQPHRRPVWVGIWEGLGDFDVTKDHYWRDAEAERALRRAGVNSQGDALFGWLDEEAEAFFRGSVLSDIRSDPWWYAAILRDRVFATVTLEKLWPWRPKDGRSMAVSTYPQQGDLDKYYGLTMTVDWFVIGRRRLEAPISLMLLPTAALFVMWLGAPYLPRWWMVGKGIGRQLLVLACPAVAALGVPVLVSTASALETQAFGLVYFLGAGFFVEEVSRAARRGTPSRVRREDR